MNPSTFTSTEPLLLDWLNETSRVFSTLKSTSHFLPQSTVSHTTDLSATARIAPDLLKALAILSDITVTRSAVDREDLKQKKGHVSLSDQQSYYIQVF